MEKVRICAAGDKAVSVVFGSVINKEINGRVRALKNALLSLKADGITEMVTTYAALAVHFEPTLIRRKDLIAKIEAVLPGILAAETEAGRAKGIKAAEAEVGQAKENPAHGCGEAGQVKEIPVLYGGEAGPDLPDCAKAEGKTEEEIIRIHTSHEHYIYMLGFSPGHPYSARDEEPFSFGRRETPRVRIPERSIVVQRNLTNITPFSQPCGWQVIGSTPLDITDYGRSEPFLFEAGDRIKFKAIDRAEYDRIREKEEKRRQAEKENTEAIFGGGLDGGPADGRGDSPADGCGGSLSDSPADLEILSPGLMTTVQDDGRYGYQAYGVSPAGPMDARAFHLANLLAGNAQNTAALELCVTGPEIRVNKNTTVALCGADFGMRIDGVPVPSYAGVPVQKGQVISFTPAKRGRYGYLAFRGGIYVPEVMGSRATLMKNQLGGLSGRKLVAGDELKLGFGLLAGGALRSLPPEVPAAKEETVTLRVVKGPQDDMFTKESLRYFFNHGAVVTDACDRQGARLQARPLEFTGAKDIVSDGISFGAIQVPGDGQPILLLSDRQTTGGYAKLGTVITADLGKAGQLMPGQQVRFVEVSPETAELIYLREYEALRKLEEAWK